MKKVATSVMVAYEFWDRLRLLEWKYRDKDWSPVKRRLQRIYDWAYPLVSRWRPMDGVPLWLYNELRHVEEGGGEGRSPGGIPNETPLLADLMYHGILGDGPWWEGNVVMPSTRIMGSRCPKCWNI